MEVYKKFMETLKPVMKFSIDQSAGSQATGREGRLLNLSEKQFLADLYVERDCEEVIEAEIPSTADLICIVGPVGSGKTSVGLNASTTILKRDPERSFLNRLDMNHEFFKASLMSDNELEFLKLLRERIINDYRNKFFGKSIVDLTEDSNNCKLWYFLLNPNYSSEERGKYQLNELLNEQQGFAILYRRHCKIQNTEITPLSFLCENYHEPAVWDLISKALDKLDICHIVNATRKLCEIETQIIFFDNIDGLPDPLQSACVKWIWKFLPLLNSLVSCIVSVREQNVWRLDSISEALGRPALMKVSLESMKDDGEFFEYPSVDMGSLSIDGLGGIIKRRLDFACLLQRKNPDKYGHEIDQLRSESLYSMSKTLVEIYKDEGLISYANNNINTLLLIHRDMLGQLLQYGLEPSGTPKALKFEKWKVATILFSWLRRTKRQYSVGVYDIVEQVARWRTNEISSYHCCTIEYLIIVCIWNLEKEYTEMYNTIHGYAKINDVLSRMTLLGFDGDQVKNKIFSLYFRSEHRENIVEFRTCDTPCANIHETL